MDGGDRGCGGGDEAHKNTIVGGCEKKKISQYLFVDCVFFGNVHVGALQWLSIYYVLYNQNILYTQQFCGLLQSCKKACSSSIWKERNNRVFGK